jgi:hypothetical protein
MKVVYKYPVPLADEVVVEIPVFAKILRVDLQFGEPCMWALVDTDEKPSKRRFMWCGTGHSADGVGAYVGTVLVSGGSFVFHLFEAP